MKRILAIAGLLLISLLAWYFFLKPADLKIHFKTTANIGHAFDELTTWSASTDLFTGNQLLKQDPYLDFYHEVKTGNATYRIEWHLIQLNDSTTRVQAGITNPERSFLNRLSIPFSDTDFERSALKIVSNYKEFLEESMQLFTIEVSGEEEIPAKFCACTKARTTPEGKAFKMMRDYNYLSGFIAEANLVPDGKPRVDIISFNEDKRLIEFDFCFPVIKRDSLPDSPDIFFRTIEASPAIKAVYHGDYRFSNKSWYSIFEFAQKKDLKFKKTPLEVYHNNPNIGGNTMQWTTEIYLPVNRF